MARKMIPSLPAEVGWGAILVSVLLGLFTLITQWRRGDIDQSARVLTEWQKLVQAHESQINRINEEFEDYRKNATEERALLRTRLNELEKEFHSYRKATDELLRIKDDEIAGLKRAIAQNSKSTAVQLGRASGVPARDDDVIGKLDKAGDNSMKGEDK